MSCDRREFRLTWRKIFETVHDTILIFKISQMSIFYLINLFFSIIISFTSILVLKGYLHIYDYIFILAISVFAIIFTYLCLVRFIVNIRNQTKVNIKGSLAQVFQLLPKALAVNCLGLIIVIMGLFLFLLPGFILTTYLVFINQILVIEKTKVIDTFKWSFLITNKNWVKLFIYNIAAWE